MRSFDSLLRCINEKNVAVEFTCRSEPRFEKSFFLFSLCFLVVVFVSFQFRLRREQRRRKVAFLRWWKTANMLKRERLRTLKTLKIVRLRTLGRCFRSWCGLAKQNGPRCVRHRCNAPAPVSCSEYPCAPLFALLFVHSLRCPFACLVLP